MYLWVTPTMLLYTRIILGHKVFVVHVVVVCMYDPLSLKMTSNLFIGVKNDQTHKQVDGEKDLISPRLT